MIALSFTGVLIYIFYRWFVWSNAKDRDVEGIPESFKGELYRERQEIATTIIGALLFTLGGEGLLDSICEVSGHFLGEDTEELCTSIYINMLELVYVVGGASFGSIGIMLVKFSKRKIEKKLNS